MAFVVTVSFALWGSEENDSLEYISDSCSSVILLTPAKKMILPLSISGVPYQAGLQIKKLLQDHKPDSVSSAEALAKADSPFLPPPFFVLSSTQKNSEAGSLHQLALLQMLTFIYLVPASPRGSSGLPTSGSSM